MANIKLTELSPITALDGSDVLVAVDVSADETHKITAANLFRTLPDGTAAAPALAFSSDQANGVYLAGTDTVGISTGGTQRVTVDGSGNVTISGGLTVEGQTTTVESTIVTIDDKNIELGSVATPTDTTADGGGITLKGATDKTIKWINSTGYWTFNTGIEVGGHIQLDDSNEIKIGNSQDLRIYHDGVNSQIREVGTGDLRLRSSKIQLMNPNSEPYFVGTSDGSAEVYYNNSKKLETKSDGIDVIGEVQCDSLDVDGAVDFDAGKVTYSSSSLSLADDVVLRFGSGNDLNIYHNGSTSYIDEAGTGNLHIRSNQTRIQKYTGEQCAKFIADGAVELYYDNAKKLETFSGGVDITGELQCDSLDVDGALDIDGGQIYYDAANNNLHFIDNVKARFGTGSDLRIYHDGSNSYIDDAGTGNLQIRGSSQVKIQKYTGENMFVGIADGAASMYYDNSQKIATKSDGIDVTGEVQCDSLDVDGVVNIGAANTSDAQLEIGAGATGNRNAYVDLIGDTTYTDYGLRVQRDNGGANGASKILHRGTGDFRFVAQEAATIEFFTSNVERLRLDSSGRLLLGTTTEGEGDADNLTIADTGNCGITLRSGTSSKSSIHFSDATSGTGEYDGFLVYNQSERKLKIGTAASTRLTIDSSGRCGIGTTAPSQPLTVNGIARFENFIEFAGSISTPATAASIYRPADNNLAFGTASVERFRITNTGAWAIEGASNYGTSGQVLTSNGNDAPTWQAQATAGGANAISMNDNVRINFGNSSDLQISHDGSHSYIENITGNLNIRQFTNDGNVSIYNDDGSGNTTVYLQCTGSDGAVRLNHYGSQKFATKSDGVDITGELQCDSLDVDGVADITGELNLHNNLSLQDNDKINFGGGNDLQIFHNGSNSFVETSSSSTGDLFISAQGTNHDLYLQATDDIFIRPQGGENAIVCTGNGGVFLYYDALQKLGTKSDGVDITGELQCDSLDVDGGSYLSGDVYFYGDNYNAVWDKSENRLKFNDNAYAAFGSSADLQIYHSGTNSYIADTGTGGLINLTNIFSVRNAADTEQMIYAQQDAQVELYYNNSKKIETKTTGVNITGNCECDSITCSGDTLITGDLLTTDNSAVFRARDGSNNTAFGGDLTNGWDIWRSTTSGGIVHFFSNVGGTRSLKSYINQNGGLTSVSDYRIKKNVAPITGAIDSVKQLNPVTFNWTEQEDTDPKTHGFLAHEFADVLPGAVAGEKDQVKEDGSIHLQMIDQTRAISLLTAALKEAITKIETLEAKVAALEAA